MVARRLRIHSCRRMMNELAQRKASHTTRQLVTEKMSPDLDSGLHSRAIEAIRTLYAINPAHDYMRRLSLLRWNRRTVKTESKDRRWKGTAQSYSSTSEGTRKELKTAQSIHVCRKVTQFSGTSHIIASWNDHVPLRFESKPPTELLQEPRVPLRLLIIPLVNTSRSKTPTRMMKN